MQEIVNYITEISLEFVPKLLISLIGLWIGLKVINWIGQLIDKGFSKQKLDKSLAHFLSALIVIILKVLLVIMIISTLGVETTSFVAVLAAMGFAIGMALSGSLSNFAGGVMILIFKPFTVGDFIEAQGFSGSVNKIDIFTTVLKTADNKTIIIPNGPLSNGNIVNFSTEKTRRVDMTFGIGYDDDIAKAKKVLDDLIKKDKRVLKDPKAVILVTELADSSVNLTVRAWVNAPDYWGLYFDMQETVKEHFDKHKLSIPFPQMDVHMKKH